MDPLEMAVFFGYSLLTLFFIIDPLGCAPLFVGLTEGLKQKERETVVRIGVLVGLITLIIFIIAGRLIFYVFGITLEAFRIAGGALLFIVAVQMIFGIRRKDEGNNEVSDQERISVGIIPLGIPLLAGPGSIATVMILSSSDFDVINMGSVILAVVIIMAITYPTLLYGDKIIRKLGRTGTTALSKIMGLILACIAAQFIIDGVIGVIETF